MKMPMLLRLHIFAVAMVKILAAAVKINPVAFRVMPIGNKAALNIASILALFAKMPAMFQHQRMGAALLHQRLLGHKQPFGALHQLSAGVIGNLRIYKSHMLKQKRGSSRLPASSQKSPPHLSRAISISDRDNRHNLRNHGSLRNRGSPHNRDKPSPFQQTLFQRMQQVQQPP
jgi:hypothetical protein